MHRTLIAKEQKHSRHLIHTDHSAPTPAEDDYSADSTAEAANVEDAAEKSAKREVEKSKLYAEIHQRFTDEHL